ncbi:radical SAM protein [Desulfothermus naphthae]
MNINVSEGMHYEGFCIRPPSEAFSILLQVTVGCSHNKCTFCGTYKQKRFRIKEWDIVYSDILFASKYMRNQNRLFLMDGDALIIPQRKLVPLIDTINKHLPWLERIGSYANAKSLRKKTLDNLIELKQKKLGILYLGVESGDDEVLREINKGATASEYVELAKKVKQAGIKLSVTVLLGIAGRMRSLEHARATGELLTKMDPDYVGALTLMLIPGTPLYEKYENGEFELPDKYGMLLELREMIRFTDLSNGLFTSNHASNYLPLKIKYPEGKESALKLIDKALRGEIGLKPEWMRAL